MKKLARPIFVSILIIFTLLCLSSNVLTDQDLDHGLSDAPDWFRQTVMESQRKLISPNYGYIMYVGYDSSGDFETSIEGATANAYRIFAEETRLTVNRVVDSTILSVDEDRRQGLMEELHSQVEIQSQANFDEATEQAFNVRPGNDEIELADGELPCDLCITNVWRRVPGGSFQMGSNEYDDEEPVHTATLSTFYMQKYEVTNAEYNRCVRAGACDKNYQDFDDFFYGDNKPVVGVSWQNSRDYCQWIGGDLPTEAQWEYAASWGTGNSHGGFKWALDRITFNSSNYCWNRWESSDDYDGTCTIGTFYPNGLGIYDLTGNVWEWCLDWYDSGFYRTAGSEYRDPVCNNDTSGSRVLRGGSWSVIADSWLRSAFRDGYSPDSRGYIGLGFRCVRPGN